MGHSCNRKCLWEYSLNTHLQSSSHSELTQATANTPAESCLAYVNYTLINYYYAIGAQNNHKQLLDDQRKPRTTQEHLAVEDIQSHKQPLLESRWPRTQSSLLEVASTPFPAFSTFKLECNIMYSTWTFPTLASSKCCYWLLDIVQEVNN